MKKLLRFSLMMLFAVFGMSNAMADDGVTFDFDSNALTMFGFTTASTGSTHDADFTESKSYTKDNFTITVSVSTTGTPNRIWGSAPALRMYGGTFTVSGSGIKKIEFTSTANKFNMTASTGTIENMVWTGTADEVVFTIGGNTQLNKIVINNTDSGGGSETPEFTTVANIAAFKALNSGDEAKLTLSDAKVLFAKGNDIFVKDNTGAIDFYKTGLSALKTGSTVSGTVIGKYSPYNNLPEFVKNDYTNANDLTITEGTVEATAVTVASVSDTYICDLIKLTNVKVVQKTENDKTNNYATDGTNEVLFYNKFSVSNALNAIDPDKPDNTYDIEGIVIYSNGNLAIGVTKAVVVNQETGESYTFVGDGSETNPYTVEDVLHMEVPSSSSAEDGQEKVWVKGYIAGAINSDKNNAIETETEINSNLALAATTGETVFKNTVPVQLSTNALKDALGIGNNPTYVDKELVVCGHIVKYFNVTGVKNVSDYVLDGVVIEEPGLAWSETSATVTIGADDNIFPTLTNPNSLAVTYESSKPEVATINSDGEITLVAAGTTKISAKFAGNDTYKASTVSYTLTVQDAETVDITNTEETAYTVAKAIELIDAGEGLSAEVFVKGIICQIDKFNDNDKSITYWISDDGTTANKFECYHGKNLEGADFTAATDLKVGATVIVKGLLKKYNTTYEFDSGNVLVSYDESTAGGNPEDAIEGGTTAETALTVDQALAYINDFPEAGFTTTNQYYVKGSVSSVTEISTDKGNATFDMNGTSGTLTIFRVKGLENNSITDENYVQNGDEVIILAKLQKYVKDNVATPEMSSGYIYSLNGNTTEQDTPVEFEGDGTQENPYTVGDLKQMKESTYPTEEVWVKGVIIGSAKSATALHDGTDEDANVASNIAIAAEGTRASSIEFVPVKLDAGSVFRTELNVLDNASNIGEEVLLKGKISKYFSTTGVTNLSEAVFKGETLGIQNLMIDIDANAPIYSLDGRRVDQNYRGVVIQNGVKRVQK